MLKQLNAILVFLVAGLGSFVVQAGRYCGLTYCYGDGAYCCYTDDATCCYDETYVYQLWWFWFIWVIFFFFIASCLICLRRRRLARRNYVQVGRPIYNGQTYGTTTVVQTQNYPGAPPAPLGQYPPPPQQQYPPPPQQQYPPAAPPPEYQAVQKSAPPPPPYQ